MDPVPPGSVAGKMALPFLILFGIRSYSAFITYRYFGRLTSEAIFVWLAPLVIAIVTVVVVRLLERER
jgi:hypothetical protein